MAITISPSTPQELATSNTLCFDASAIVSLPGQEETAFEIGQTAEDDWTHNPATRTFKKVSGVNGTITGANIISDTAVYGKQPFYITGCNSTFVTPGPPTNNCMWFIGVQDDNLTWYWLEVFKFCDNNSIFFCNANSGTPWYMAVRYKEVGQSAVTIYSRTVSFNERFYVKSDGINLSFYRISGGQPQPPTIIPLPETNYWRFICGAAYVGNEITCLGTYKGSYQGRVPITWSTPLGGDLTVTGDRACFSSDFAGDYQVCADSEFDEPVCVDIHVSPLNFFPVGLFCSECVFTGEVVDFTSNGGLEGTLTAVDNADGITPVGTVINPLQWQAPNTKVDALLSYTLNGDTVTCLIQVVDRPEVLNVSGNTITGLVPGDTFQIVTNYEYPDIIWENVDCSNIISPDGTIQIPTRLNDSCFGALDCYVRGRLMNVPNATCDNLTGNGEVFSQYTIDLRVIVDPTYPTPDFGGPKPTKWLQDVPEYAVSVNKFEGGCEETYLKNRIATQNWQVNYSGLLLQEDEVCFPDLGCDESTGFVNGFDSRYSTAKRLDDFWNLVAGTAGYFTLVDYRTGYIWKKCRFSEKMGRDHINWRTSNSRNVRIKWAPCCAAGPLGGVCPHESVINDIYPPTIPQNLILQILSETQIDVFWDAAFDNIGIKGYELDVDGTVIDVSNVLLYHHISLSPGSTHTYRVRAYDFSNNFSEWSTSVTGTTLLSDHIPPTVPGKPSVTPVDDTIVFAWNASTDNDGVEGYLILVDGEVIDVGNVLEYHHTGLALCSEHEYYVRAYDAAGNKSAWSHRLTATVSCNENVYESTDQVLESVEPVVE